MPEIEDLSGRKLGEFVLRARIGEGGFGAVYRCEQPLLGREAVVKVLHPRLRHNNVVLQRFLREAQLASQLDHPGAAHIYAFGIERDDGLFWIAMEMVQGIGLNRWLQAHGAMPLERFVPLFEQLAEVVHAAHQRGIVHRDLKPSNIMVIERAGRLTPKLLDFGVAKLLADAPARHTAPALPVPGDAGDDEVARVTGARSMSGPGGSITETASTPLAEGRDARRLTHMDSMVGSPPYMSPEQWLNPSEVGTSSDLYALGVIAYRVITGRRPFHAATVLEYADLHCEAAVPPVGDGLPGALDRFFERALAKRPEQRWGTAPELAAALRAEWIATRVSGATRAGREPSEAAVASDDEVAPYLGLAPYAAGDAGRFVGREAEVAAFLDRLRTRPLHVVVGPPGTGKSSFVHAGVLSGLPPGWRTVALRPGAAPLAALAFRLEAAGVRGDDLRAVLASSPAEAAARVAEVAGDGAVVVVIDQLEELFTLGASGEERAQFAAVIAQLAASVDLPVRVIATIRDDYLMQLDGLPALRPGLGSALVLLGNPLHDDLVRVVVEPARRAGYTLSDPELAHDMVRAVASRPGALALLSFTALRLWQLRDRTLRQLTRSAYDAMDGVAGALVRHAEATLEALPADDQRLAREIFRQLVTADGARAPLSAAELHQRLATPRSAMVLDALIAARLIAMSDAAPDASGAPQTQVEVIHDALLEAWPRLRRWIREDVDGMRMREQLRVAARQWSDRGRPRGLLWRDDALVDLQRWLRQPRATQLSELEAAFVEASRRLARLGRVRLGLVAIGLAIAVAAFGYNLVRTRIDQSVVEHARTQSYTDWGQAALLNGKPLEALLYLDQAARRGDESARVTFMLARAVEPFQHEVARLHGEHGPMWWASYSHDGHRIVTTDDRGAQVWNADSMTLERSLPHGSRVFQAEFTPDGTQIVTGGADGTVQVWDARTGQRTWSLRRGAPGDRGSYVTHALSPRGAQVAAIDDADGVVSIWDLHSGALLHELAADAVPRSSSALDFSHDGRWLATSTEADASVYDTTTWERVRISGGDVTTLSFDPTSQRLATATAQGDVSIWSIPSGERQWHLRESGDRVMHVAFSPDGTFVVATGRDGIDRIWNTRNGELHAELKNHHGASVWGEFDASSRLMVSVDDHEVTITDVALRLTVSTLDGPTGLIRSVHFDPRARHVVAASWDGTARIWNTTPSYLRWATPPRGADCRSVHGEPDRRFIAEACGERGTSVWDTQDPAGPRLLARLPSPTPVTGDFFTAPPAVSAAGDRAAIASDNVVAIYGLPDGRIVSTVHHDAPVTTVAFGASGHALVTGSTDGSLLVTQDGNDPVEVARLPAAVDIAAMLPDGRVVVADARPRLGLYRVVHHTAPTVEHALQARATFLRWSPDGQRLLVIPETGTVQSSLLWRLDDPARSWQLDSHNTSAISARFASDHRAVLIGSGDGTARLWDAQTGRLTRSYAKGEAYVGDVAFDSDGAFAVTADGNGVLRFWDVPSGQLIWVHKAHRSPIIRVQFEGASIVTRTLAGEIARWELSKLVPLHGPGAALDRIIPCLPLRFDPETRGLIEQEPDSRCGT